MPEKEKQKGLERQQVKCINERKCFNRTERVWRDRVEDGQEQTTWWEVTWKAVGCHGDAESKVIL